MTSSETVDQAYFWLILYELDLSSLRRRVIVDTYPRQSVYGGQQEALHVCFAGSEVIVQHNHLHRCLCRPLSRLCIRTTEPR